ncbi:porin [Chromobacterium alticapitis]|uniref:Porin n=1 Tax=Chromobacterium alticapitis TaxID=2073169 RepID=A0A2S5DH09_9NEIS|nr:porin [Chromobacterium alticapitis]POZ62319.1 porin [Chromobacterium alticapitis]
MKKSLIALLVATLPAAAFADVTIYGKIKGGVENVDNGTTKVTNVDDLGSRIGFKGAEDLGNGLKTIWQVETGFGIDGQARDGSSSGTFANRNSFIGLQGSFGTVRLGNVSNFQDSDMGTVDTWEYRNNALGLGLFTRDGDRLKNSVRYDLPAVVPGLTAAFQYGTKEDKSANSTAREIYNLGLGYENSGFFGKYDYEYGSHVAGAIAKSDKGNRKHQLEVGYNANNLFVGFGFKQNQGDLSTTALSVLATPAQMTAIQAVVGNAVDVKTTEYALTTSYSFGAITPKFTYAHGDNLKANGATIANSKYDQFVLGADYALSKRTTIGAQYGEIKLGDNAAALLIGNNQDKIKAFGLNMVHAF